MEEERAATEGGDFTHTAITLLNGSAAGDELLDVDSVVIIDRWLDLMTPMITQFTFGGAVEELFGIDIDGGFLCHNLFLKYPFFVISAFPNYKNNFQICCSISVI